MEFMIFSCGERCMGYIMLFIYDIFVKFYVISIVIGMEHKNLRVKVLNICLLSPSGFNL